MQLTFKSRQFLKSEQYFKCFINFVCLVKSLKICSLITKAFFWNLVENKRARHTKVYEVLLIVVRYSTLRLFALQEFCSIFSIRAFTIRLLVISAAEVSIFLKCFH